MKHLLLLYLGSFKINSHLSGNLNQKLCDKQRHLTNTVVN